MAMISGTERVHWAERSEGTVVGIVPAYKKVRARLGREERERVCHAYDELRGFRRAIIEDASGRLHIVACARLTVLPKAPKVKIVAVECCPDGTCEACLADADLDAAMRK